MSRLRTILRRFHNETISIPRAEKVACAISRLAGPNESLLDVGACDGLVASRVGALVGATRVAGVDVLPQPNAHIDVRIYDGRTLPFEEASFDVVTISDVLHHAEDPLGLLSEAVRVSRRAVVVKDHFRFGPISNAVLKAMDQPNLLIDVHVRGRYFSLPEWLTMVDEANASMVSLEWPLLVHGWPFRLIARPELQFAARLEPKLSRAAR